MERIQLQKKKKKEIFFIVSYLHYYMHFFPISLFIEIEFMSEFMN